MAFLFRARSGGSRIWCALLPGNSKEEFAEALARLLAEAKPILGMALGAAGPPHGEPTEKTLSNSSSEAVPPEGKCPTPGGSAGGGARPSAKARRFSRYHAAARVLYFWRIGKSSGMPCSRMKSAKRWLPPNSIMRKCNGFQESSHIDCTKLTATPKLLCAPAGPMLR
eukprot:CAMPEP_0171079674 /NCGR_PEP_ID=MMETSP0766_2-20121228/15398_1 /TAXON_ID=439317 /ORGANISM="Gambierdiscus australes, Strain CAWD 149" /LENGTH=167 /DNA_ID=CAMNT_0011536877 /DNA_START=138 /DNA_END=642 /DNA_ORIENTATION=-